MTMFCDCGNPEAHRGEHIPKPVTDTPLDPDAVRALCDAAGEVERLREEVSLARRIIDLDMRLHAPSASTAGCGGGIGGQMMTPHCPDYCEHPKHDADKALREDLLRDFYRLARTPLPERDASRTAHAAIARSAILGAGDHDVRHPNGLRYVNPRGDGPSDAERHPSSRPLAEVRAELARITADTTGDRT